MAKTGTELANQMLKKKHPDDIVKGYTDLGYDASIVDSEFDAHKKDLIDPDDPREYSDDEVYEYMRQHLKDGGIKPFKGPVKRIDEKLALNPTEVEKSKFKKGQYNLREEWNKYLDDLEKKNPRKKEVINKMRGYDDEAVEVARMFISMMKGE